MSSQDGRPGSTAETVRGPSAGSGGMGKSARGPDTGFLPSVKVEDLTHDALIAGAGRGTFRGQPVPMLGGILLLAKLGQGGMGAVYYGFHQRLRKEVAVKVLPFHLAERNESAVLRFYQEAQIAAQIQSPHLVGVMDVNSENGLYYLVMEFVSGLTAHKYQRTTAPAGLTEIEALDICIAATTGLQTAHKSNVVHRDIKPDNILIPRNPGNGAFLPHAAKVSDLGLAHSDVHDNSVTQSGTCMGTPGFMSPEQAADAGACGPATDVFSMGATLFCLLAGHPPFQGETSFKILVATSNAPHESIRSIRPEVSKRTAQVIDICLYKQPARRYADASVLLKELKACRTALTGGLDSSTRSTDVLGATLSGTRPQTRFVETRPVPAPAPAARRAQPAVPVAAAQPAGWKTNRGLLYGALAAAGVLVVALLIWVFKPPPNAKDRVAQGSDIKASTVKSDVPIPAVEAHKTALPERTEKDIAASEQRRSKLRRALSDAMPLATHAKQKEDWKGVITMLGKLVDAPENSDHPARPIAEKLLTEARSALNAPKTAELPDRQAPAVTKTAATPLAPQVIPPPVAAPVVTPAAVTADAAALRPGMIFEGKFASGTPNIDGTLLFVRTVPFKMKITSVVEDKIGGEWTWYDTETSVTRFEGTVSGGNSFDIKYVENIEGTSWSTDGGHSKGTLAPNGELKGRYSRSPFPRAGEFTGKLVSPKL